MKGDLVETNIKIIPSVPVKTNKKMLIFSTVFLLCYIVYFFIFDYSSIFFLMASGRNIISNGQGMELIPMFLGASLLYFTFKLIPHVDNNKYLIIALICAPIGLLESFRLTLFIIAVIFGFNFNIW